MYQNIHTWMDPRICKVCQRGTLHLGRRLLENKAPLQKKTNKKHTYSMNAFRAYYFFNIHIEPLQNCAQTYPLHPQRMR